MYPLLTIVLAYAPDIHPLLTNKFLWPLKFPWVPSPPSKPPQLDRYCCESSWVRSLSHVEWVSRFISVVCWSAPRCWVTFHFRTRLQLCLCDLLMAVWTVSSLELLWTRLLLMLILSISVEMFTSLGYLKVDFLSHKKGAYWSFWETTRSFLSVL